MAGDDWRVDEHTKEVGRRGVAQAQAALPACGASWRGRR
jgi:hypothetical protein